MKTRESQLRSSGNYRLRNPDKVKETCRRYAKNYYTSHTLPKHSRILRKISESIWKSHQSLSHNTLNTQKTVFQT